MLKNEKSEREFEMLKYFYDNKIKHTVFIEKDVRMNLCRYNRYKSIHLEFESKKKKIGIINFR